MSEQTTQSPAPNTSTEPAKDSELHYHHEAEKTELEKWLSSGLTKLEPYSNQLLMGFIGIAVLIVAATFIFGSLR